MIDSCHQCQAIIEQLQLEDRGQEARCPICCRRYARKHWVLDEAGFLVNERWQESDRPTCCTQCNGAGPMRSTANRTDDCFPHRYLKCGAAVANRKGEE
ncbi:MAG: hypothetical protein SA339_06145 [Methanomassiliicoccus sp.]|nr:hypothetical protein [Methanomassiliicoccus sp.]